MNESSFEIDSPADNETQKPIALMKNCKNLKTGLLNLF